MPTQLEYNTTKTKTITAAIEKTLTSGAIITNDLLTA